MKQLKVLLLNLTGIRFCSTSKMAAQCHSQGINQQNCVKLFQYSDWFCRTSRVGVTKNMQVVLKKWTPWDKYFNYQNFLTHLPLSLFP